MDAGRNTGVFNTNLVVLLGEVCSIAWFGNNLLDAHSVKRMCYVRVWRWGRKYVVTGGMLAWTKSRTLVKSSYDEEKKGARGVQKTRSA